MTKREIDLNGWLEVKDNPISKVGVFDYLGSEIGAPDPGKIYKVLRPEEELADPECIKSFKLLPFIDDHAMLGAEDEGKTPAEQKGVQGMIGEQVYFDAPYLRGNIKIVSEATKNLIKNGRQKGKVDLSPGYRCRYDFTPGVFNGQHYDAIQRDIRGNHLALVDRGRTGPDVAIQDHHFKLTIDTAELIPMADENITEGGGDTLAKIKELLATLKPLLEAQAEANALLQEAGLMRYVEPQTDEEVIKVKEDDEGNAKVETEEIIRDPNPEIVKKLESMDARMKKLEGQAQDSAVVVSIADRDELASKLSGFIGSFDHARMTATQVAQYGVKQLGLKVPEGSERVALDAWMHGRIPDHNKPIYSSGTAQDSGSDIFSNWGKK